MCAIVNNLNDKDIDNEMVVLNNSWFSKEYSKLVCEEGVTARRSMIKNDDMSY